MQSFTGARDPRAVAEARDFVAGAVDAEGCTDLARTAALLSSELASNAVMHGDTAFAVRVTAVGDGVRVEVDDEGGGEPVDLQVDADADRGRGLMIVASMSRRWGVDHHRDGVGKTVWFEL